MNVMTALPRRFTTSALFFAGALVCLFGFLHASPPSTSESLQTETVVIEPVGDKLEYATKEITAKSGTQLTIVMNNTASSPIMHHNVAVLELAVDNNAGINEVGAAAMKAGEAGGYIPDHEAIIAATPMAAPGKRTEITFTVPPPGSYPYVCLYPGHYVVMRGTLISTP